MEYIYQVKLADLSDMPKPLRKNCVFMNGTGEDITFPVTITGKQVTDFEGEITFKDKDSLSELNYYSAIGALLWKKSNDTFAVNNGRNPKCYQNVTESDYVWDPTATSDTFTWPTHDKDSSNNTYTLIGVCVGFGKWAYIERTTSTDSSNNKTESFVYTGLTSKKNWADSSTDLLYTTYFGKTVHADGYANTNEILDFISNNKITVTGIWEALKTAKKTSGLDLYIPSKYELLECQENCCDDKHSNIDGSANTDQLCTYTKNMGKLLSLYLKSYWSSSLYSYGYSGASGVYFNDSDIYSYRKNNPFYSISFLHF